MISISANSLVVDENSRECLVWLIKASDYIQGRVLNIRFCTRLMGLPFFSWVIPTYRVLPYSMICTCTHFQFPVIVSEVAVTAVPDQLRPDLLSPHTQTLCHQLRELLAHTEAHQPLTHLGCVVIRAQQGIMQNNKFISYRMVQ